MASTYLSRTQGTATNRKIFTWSAWIKRANISNNQILLGTRTDGSNRANIRFEPDDFDVFELSSGSFDWYIKTNRLFRDTSAWYHIVFIYDSTQATDTNRLKIYVNGTQETSYQQVLYPSLNFETDYTSASTLYVGSDGSGDYFNGQMAHVHFIDGTAYDADTFGETDATTGIWKPKTAPSVTYGTNGFFLKFENSGAFGTDSSGNANNFTVNGTMTQTIDTPSNVFATWNPLYPSANLTYSNGNNTVTSSSTSWTNGVTTGSTFAIGKGKWYWEVKWDNDSSSNGIALGVFETEDSQNNLNNYLGEASSGIGYFLNTNEYYFGGVATSLSSSFSQGDIISIALDMDNNYIYFGENGTFLNSGDPTSGSSGTGGIDISSFSGTLTPALSTRNNNTLSANFGNGYFGTTAVSSAQNPDDGIGIFEYDVPTGYRALCTKSINAEEYS